MTQTCMVRRRALPRWWIASLLSLGLVLPLAPAPGSRAAEPAPPPPPTIKVAILPLVNASPDLSAKKIMEDILREAVKNVPPARATFLLPIDSERILTERQAIDRAYRLTERWSKFGTIDSTAMAGLDSIVTADAVLFVKVSEWENHRVTVIGSGESHTTIGLALACYDIRSMKRIWSKQPREQRFGQEIDPSSGAVAYDETGFIQNKRASDPPRFEDVASDLVREAFRKFPAK